MALTDEQATFFTDNNFGHLATVRKDGSPHVSPVWLDYDGSRIIFNSADGRAKTRQLERDGRASVSVQRADNPYEYIEVSGPVELSHEGAEAHIDKMAKKYIDQDVYPWRSPTEVRVLAYLTPEKVTHYKPY
jgi:PPOX class probable F420-dependent enzyme